jgi:AraC family transcriptional regulator of arabinose operon
MDPRVKLALEILTDSRFAREGLARASKSTNLSPSRLRHLITAETSVPPAKQIKRVKIERAAELLRSTFLSIKEVAAQVEAGDISHFVRNFKQAFGVSPKAFRRALRTERRHSQP